MNPDDMQPDVPDDIDAEFKGILDADMAASLQNALDQQIERCRQWRNARRAFGNEPTLHDMVHASIRGGISGSAAIGMACAAIWRHLEAEDGS